jgi:DNA polymerase alpha-associated DNA helicase A
VNPDEIAIISPYMKQVQLIRQRLLMYQDVRVGTVDSFQGQEKDIVIFSAVRSNSSKDIGFL